MKRCRTCAHWTQVVEGEIDPDDYGRCELLTANDFEQLYVQVKDEFGLEVRTRPNFACVLHESREEAE